MKNKHLIINLIHQDLIHSQLLYGLRSIGLSTQFYQLSIINIIEGLMRMESEIANDVWNNAYFSFLELAQRYPVSESGEELRPLAEACYQVLLACNKTVETD